MEITHKHLLQAVAMAARAHQGQMRKDDRTPYVSHPFRVCLVVREVFGCGDPRMLLTAILHDTIEDTRLDFDDIEEQFGPEIAHWVGLLSKDKRLPEAEREEAYCQGLENAPSQVRACKLADMYDNLTDMDMLPRQSWPHTLQKLRIYFDRLRLHPAPELEKPLAIVQQLLDERAKILTRSASAGPP